jgi:hypothetical protein
MLKSERDEAKSVTRKGQLKRKTYHAIIGSRFTTKRKWFFGDTLVYNSMWEHRLTCDAKNEGPEGDIIIWLGFAPHAYRLHYYQYICLPTLAFRKYETLTFHNRIHLPHRADYLAHPVVEGFPVGLGTRLKCRNNAINEGPRIPHHIDVHKYKACF